eukprot:1887389-Pyramimonas_sp.AAC.1
MRGPWKAVSKLFGRGAANESGQGWTEEARMQGYPWEGCPSLPCGSTVSRGSLRSSGPGGCLGRRGLLRACWNAPRA